MINKALAYAIEKETGITSPYSGEPQILHIVEVINVIRNMTDDENVIAAAILHGVNEDNRINVDEIREIFGDKIVSMMPPISYAYSFMERKKDLVSFLNNKATEPQEKIILANELANMRMVQRVYDCIEEKVWDRFEIDDCEEMEFLCYDFIDAFKGMNSYREYEEYCDIVDDIFDSCCLWRWLLGFFGLRTDYNDNKAG